MQNAPSVPQSASVIAAVSSVPLLHADRPKSEMLTAKKIDAMRLIMNLLSTGAAGSSDGGSIDRLTLSNGERRGNLFTQRVSES
jgi:hypothetical protein